MRSAAAVVFDSFETTPEYGSLRDAITALSWPSLERELVRLPPDQASVAITQLAEIKGVEAYLTRVVAEHPDSHVAKTALAARFVSLAWAARSRRQAEHVSKREFDGFFDWLDKAEELLEAVLIEAPHYAPAWSMSLYTVRGLQLGHDELWRRSNAHSALSPYDYPAQIQQLQFLLPKWFGTWDLAAGFVRAVAAAAPLGSSTHALVPLLHIEKWAELNNARAGKAHMRRPKVLEEIRAAAGALLSAPAPLDPVSAQAHNAFVAAFWLSGQLADAAPHVRFLDGRVTEFPWRYVVNAQRVIPDIHRKALAKKQTWFRR